ncbi:MAG: twin-arginine translocase TatA/TatE family subunit [Dehalococcoidales bacterium]|nr:twin-arginine translocase TatA/TatE family subunit [Dehalococcoidales bacterium]
MGFLDMGPMEILLILIVALIIWGPDKLPELARTVGKTLRTFRKATSDLTSVVTRELDLEEKKPQPPQRGQKGRQTPKLPEKSQTEAKDTGKTNPEGKPEATDTTTTSPEGKPETQDTTTTGPENNKP